MKQDQQKSPHILNAASNLTGICFILITSLRIFGNKGERTVIDEAAAIAILFFMTSCILSFLSMRTSGRKSQQLETFADYLFLSGLGLLFITTLLFVFNIIH
ncbi:hypothetical protein [Niabella drilacis]|uniref:Uncharacterized protein n=1 Tax=Niabella drilacis (strain DSM 25811 / CCM 8410 / CCUG 62505 / LMG 26954 / E90) TaxID=1285928 RepID=A0A1G6JN12_NIADE|nr:hypothetical protein [Niabella drilacis]SDC20152.1 hypothetical protein SAMN04487894_101587 [Niabella drilacis]